MLMQNFKTAADLNIKQAELVALIKVLGMLERCDLVDVEQETRCENGFNMGTQGRGCGTPACIGGWVARLMDIDQMTYVDGYLPHRTKNEALTDLYWNDRAMRANASQATTALRSYLTIADARWDLALS